MRKLLFVMVLGVVACAPAAPEPVLPPLTTASAIATPTTAAATVPEGPQPPVARREPHAQVVSGVTLPDDYAWLRNKGAPEVLGYLEAENAYTAAMMKPTEAFQEALYKEMLARIKETDQSVPVKRGAFVYYTRTEEGRQYPIHCRKKQGAADAKEEVLLDLNEIGKTEKFVAIGDMEVSDDGNLLAYTIDTAGFRQYTLEVKDLRTGKLGSEHIPRVDGVELAKDNKTLFYVTQDAQTKRTDKLFRHVLGADASKDPLLYEEKDERFDIGVSRSRSKDFIFATSSSKMTSEVRYVSAAHPEAAFKVIVPREQGHEYYVDHRGESFYIRTNSGGRNFRIVTAPIADPRRDKWKEIVAHDDDVMIEDLDVFADHYVLWERQDALPRIRIVDFRSGASARLDMPEAVYELAQQQNPEFAAQTLRYNYQSFTTPSSVYEYDLKTKARKLLKQTEVLGGYDATRYESARLHAVARDGTRVPISVVYKKGAPPGQPRPMFLYGYGSYGITIPTEFSSSRVSLLDRGVVYALAHIRGGGDLGKKWHDGGRMATKMNTFTDFIDCADYLVKERWTAKDKLVIEGGSAGGLLMGAVTNMRPDLFKAVIAKVPFVDVVNTMYDESLPLTVGEFEEWGNPKIKEQLGWMLAYSPYDNVAAKAYPAMLVKSSYNDSQVMYWEPAKWVAKLRAMKTDKNPLLLKMNLEPAGHGGHSGRYDRLRDTAFDFAFLLGQFGVTS